MERSHKLNNDNLNNSNLNMTKSSEKKVRFDDSFISNLSPNNQKQEYTDYRFKSETKSINSGKKSDLKSTAKKINSLNNDHSQTKLHKNNLMARNTITIFDNSNLNMIDHLKKFEVLGTGAIKVSKKNRTFKKSKIKGINSCIRYPITLNSGVKSFKFKIMTECIMNDSDSLIAFMFEKPYKSNYICKTRMMKNGVGITSAGQSIGQYNNLKCDFSINPGDLVQSVIDFDKNLISFYVNDGLVYQSVSNLDTA